MDSLAENELFEAAAGLGNWHQVGEKFQYLANRDECLSCLTDIKITLKNDTPQTGYCYRRKLGEWQVLSNHLVPLFTSYREDQEISTGVLKLMVQLTTRVGLNGSSQLQHLHHLQDYKEAFAKKDVFIILMGLLVETMEEDEEAEARPNRAEVFKAVLTLLCNLISVPDPDPGDPGYTPLRRNQQLVYIRHFHDEGVLDFFLLFAEGVAAEQGGDDWQAWALADILYHICTHVSPEDLMKNGKDKNKRELSDMLEREKADAKFRAPQSSRHSRFGTAMQSRSADGSIVVSASVNQTDTVVKGGALWRREYRDKAGPERKQNMFHDPFFVDLEEGSVRDHNQLNPHLRGSLEGAKNHPDAVIAGLRKFFEEFVQTSFSSLVSILRSSSSKKSDGPLVGTEFNRPHLLNFVSWFLEFHRHHHSLEVAKAKKSGQPLPVMDISSIQGAIDLDMIQFTTARLREFGKESNIHASHLVIALRTVNQQVKTMGVVTDSTDSDTRDCGDILTQNIVKDDVMAHLSWIMKNYKTSSHDPRILSYSVEVFHHMLRLMSKVSERQGRQLEFQVERSTGARMTRTATTSEKEVAGLADARVVENLFYLLEKYRRHTPQLHSMLVKLLYQIVRAQPTNCVVFFELSYFMRIYRMMSDPLVSAGGKQTQRYAEMVSLLQYILRQFFKCAEINGCVFAELLFRKVQENAKESILESHHSEFAAVLDNYENEEYRRILDRMGAGETLNAMRQKQRAIITGALPWTEEEDTVLRERYAMYADHPLCAELLAAELPEESKRTAQQVRKRLVELNLVSARGAGGRAEAQEQVDEDLDDVVDEPAAKKVKLMELEMPGAQSSTAQDGRASPGTPDGAADREAAEMLEEDLERLLDAAFDNAEGTFPGAPAEGVAGAFGGAPMDLDLDLEMELEAMLEEPEAPSAVGAAPATAASLPKAASSSLPATEVQPSSSGGTRQLEMELENLLDEALPTAPAASSSSSSSAPPPRAVEKVGLSQAADSLELDLERLLDEAEEPGVGSSATPAAPAGAQGASQPRPSQVGPPSQNEADSLELDLERLLDEPMSQSRPSQVGLSQSDNLERDLERLIDEGPTPASAPPSARRLSAQSDAPASQLGEAPPAAASQAGPLLSQTGDSLELDLERLLDEEA
mmetsp:Transcript_19341/g.34440  ORF Transcript_19341/g.34440 Transcript_19341/m.34440 type:complete len:1151 (-) Transcript_19341:75-3527(-)